MSPEGSVWLAVARIGWAEQIYHERYHHYGALSELTGLVDGLPASVTSGRQGVYTLTVRLTDDGYILRAHPYPNNGRRVFPSFYGDQTQTVWTDRSGNPAGPDSEVLWPATAEPNWRRFLRAVRNALV